MTISHTAPETAFTALRGFLDGAGYTFEGIRRRTGRVPDEYLKILPGSVPGPIADALDLAIRLFLTGELVDETALSLAGAEVRTALQDLGLVAPWPENPRQWYSPVALYPIGNVWVVSDRWAKPDLSPPQSPADVVYPVTPNTLRFMEAIPPTPCERFLEACGGTGIGALLAARNFAGHAWSADVAERAVNFSEFARRLNGLDNATTCVSDIYSAVAGVQFDRIAAHPPYVPVLEAQQIWSDGGADGQEITRRLVEDAPRVLAPGGRLYVTATGIDRAALPFEECLRRWLGPQHSREFDVAVFVRKYQSPAEVALQLTARNAGGQPMVERWLAQFAGWKVENFVQCSFVLQRREQARTVFTARRDATPRVTWREMEPLLAWETRTVQPGFAAELAQLRPKWNPGATIDVQHKIADGQMRPVSCRLKLERPFDLSCEIEPWTIFLLSRADGSRTVDTLFEDTRREGLIPEATRPGEFADLVATLISGGFLSVD